MLACVVRADIRSYSRTAFAALLAPAETDFGRVGKDYASGESTTAPASLASAMLEVRKIVLRGLPSIEEEAGRVVSEVSEVGVSQSKFEQSQKELHH